MMLQDGLIFLKTLFDSFTISSSTMESEKKTQTPEEQTVTRLD